MGVEAKNLDFFYGTNQALKKINLQARRHRVTALIGPSGCGKSTFLRCINRMNDLIDGTKMTGLLTVNGVDIYKPQVDIYELRAMVGMVFQKPNPFPTTIFKNVEYGLKVVQGIRDKTKREEIVVNSLKRAYLWDEVKDKLHSNAGALSGGQQQRLCIARTIAVQPQIILMDEPCSALDPVATAKIEDLILELRESFTIIIVTHNMQQAQRASDYTAFFHHGELVEFNVTKAIFLSPENQRTKDYISGRFG